MRRIVGFGVYRGFDKSRKNGWFVSVAQGGNTKRRPKTYYPSEKERDKAYAKKINEVRSVGLDAAAEFTTADRHTYAEIKRLTPEGMSPLEVFHRGLQQIGTISIRSLTFEQAAKGFSEEQALRLAEKKISEPRHKEIRLQTARFVAAFGSRHLSAINRTFVKTYLANLKVSPQTRVNTAKNLAFILNWFVAEGMMFSNPVPEQESVPRIPATFTNEQVANLFRVAHTEFETIVPMLIVQWYAGLRPNASHHLRWEHVDFERGRIMIQPESNKMRQPDIVQDVPPSVFAQLLPFRQESGRIAPASHIDIAKALHRKLGFRGPNKDGDPVNRWPEDVSRHTFASNLVALYDQDLKRVSAVLLHAGSRTLLKHYLLKNVPRLEAERYFSVGLPIAN